MTSKPSIPGSIRSSTMASGSDSPGHFERVAAIEGQPYGMVLLLEALSSSAILFSSSTMRTCIDPSTTLSEHYNLKMD